MRTKKEISTISYLSPEFLKNSLNALMKDHVISDYMFIFHKMEEDEKKDHIHLWIRPNTLIDTMYLQEYLVEYDPKNPSKPKKCIDFRTTSTDDWILYSVHDPDYLLTKGETRKYSYTKDDIVSPDPDNFDQLWFNAYHGSKFAEQQRQLKDLFEFNYNKADLIRQGRMPIHLASQLLALDHLERTYRGYHENHELQEDINTYFTKEERKKIKMKSLFLWLQLKKGYTEDEAEETVLRVQNNMEVPEEVKNDVKEYILEEYEKEAVVKPQ